MAQTVKELMDLGLSKAEAERVINRKAKWSEKRSVAVARAERLLPKAQEELDYAAGRVEMWAKKAEKANARVEKYIAIIDGTSNEDASDEG